MCVCAGVTHPDLMGLINYDPGRISCRRDCFTEADISYGFKLLTSRTGAYKIAVKAAAIGQCNYSMEMMLIVQAGSRP